MRALTPNSYVIQVEWDETATLPLPTLIGPFKTATEANEWAELNIPNGTWNLEPLSWPYSGGSWRYA